MTYIILPARSRRLPVGPVRLNRRSELAQSLKALWVPYYASTRSLIELVSGAVDHGTGTIIPASYGDGSRGLDFTATSNYVDGGARAINTATSQSISVMALIVPGALTRSDVLCRWNTQTGQQDQFVLLYGLTSGKAKFYVWETGGASTNSQDATTTMAVGSKYMIGGVAIGNSLRGIYVNGVLENSITAAIGLMNANPTTNYRIGDDVHGDGNFNGQFYFGAVWDAGLDASAFREAYLNPYQLVERVVSRLYFIPAAAGAADGSVAFAGSGALSAVGKENAAASVAFAGVGAFAVVGKELAKASTAFSGTGSMSAVGKALAKAASALSGSGSFAPVGKTLANGAVAFVGAGALVPVGKESAAASVAFAGGSTFAPVSAQSGAGAVAFAGSATFSPTGVTLAKAAAAFAGAASFAPVGQEFAKGNVSFAGLGAFAPAGQVSAQGVGAVTFAGLGAFAPVATAIAAGSVAFGGSGGFDVQSTGAAAESSGGRVGPAPPRRIHLVPMIARVHTGQSAQTVRARATLTLVVVSARTRQAGQATEAAMTLELDGQVATASAAEIRAFVGMRMLASGKGWQPGQGGRLAANAGMDTKVTSGIFPREPPPTYDGPTFEGLDPRYRNAA